MSIVALSMGVISFVLHSISIIKSKCCNSECIIKTKKNNSSHNIEGDNINNV